MAQRTDQLVQDMHRFTTKDEDDSKDGDCFFWKREPENWHMKDAPISFTFRNFRLQKNWQEELTQTSWKRKKIDCNF